MDPLFKKTSADFDEGGARGLLLNHLSIDRDGKIIFDASDASNTDHARSDHDELLPEDGEHNDKEAEQQNEPKVDTVDEDIDESTEKSVEKTAVEDPMDVDEQLENTDKQPDTNDEQPDNAEVNVKEESSADKVGNEKVQDTLIEISRLRGNKLAFHVLLR